MRTQTLREKIALHEGWGWCRFTPKDGDPFTVFTLTSCEWATGPRFKGKFVDGPLEGEPVDWSAIPDFTGKRDCIMALIVQLKQGAAVFFWENLWQRVHGKPFVAKDAFPEYCMDCLTAEPLTLARAYAETVGIKLDEEPPCHTSTATP